MTVWNDILAFAKAHPEMFWALMTAFLTALFKPRSDEEYAKLAQFSPRVAAGLKLMSAFGLDPVKAVEAIKEFVSPPAPALPAAPAPVAPEAK